MLALIVIASAPGADAARLDQIATHYSKLNDGENVGIFDVAFSIATQSSPAILTWLGDDIRYDVTLGQYFDGENDNNDNVSFVYAGPTWQYQPDWLWPGNVVEIGTAAGYISDERVGDRDLGGRWQFTSHFTLGYRFGAGRHWRVGLRFQHTSNAGLESPNPGLDAGLIEFGYRF